MSLFVALASATTNALKIRIKARRAFAHIVAIFVVIIIILVVLIILTL
jgi:hypothetical protein